MRVGIDITMSVCIDYDDNSTTLEDAITEFATRVERGAKCCVESVVLIDPTLVACTNIIESRIH